MLKFCSAILNHDHTLQIELYITGATKTLDKSKKIVKQDNLAIGKFAENVEQFAVRKKHPLFSYLSKRP